MRGYLSVHNIQHTSQVKYTKIIIPLTVKVHFVFFLILASLIIHSVSGLFIDLSSSLSAENYK